jgi:glycosyltransferase involved in cell wall biosynthesis
LEKLPENFTERDLKWPPKYLWTQLRLWWELWRNPPDVLLVPAHTIPFLPLPKKIKIAVTVHDVGFKRSPELYKPIQVLYHDLTMRRIKQRADIIITISEFSKREIMELYGVPAEKIKISYLGFDANKFFVQGESEAIDSSPVISNETIDTSSVIPTEMTERNEVEESLSFKGSLDFARDDKEHVKYNYNKENDNGVLKKYNITKPYLLYVGRMEKKKNIAGIILAFALAKETNPELKLVLAGSAGHQFEEIKKIITDHRLENEVIITGYVDNNDLPVIYNQAEIFLFPTLYEGFGLPILESMASGVPVITSNFEPHTEVGGDSAYYADPYSPEALADGINKLMSDLELRQSLKEKGLVRVKEFSWDQTATRIYEMVQ